MEKWEARSEQKPDTNLTVSFPHRYIQPHSKSHQLHIQYPTTSHHPVQAITISCWNNYNSLLTRLPATISRACKPFSQQPEGLFTEKSQHPAWTLQSFLSQTPCHKESLRPHAVWPEEPLQAHLQPLSLCVSPSNMPSLVLHTGYGSGISCFVPSLWLFTWLTSSCYSGVS